MTEQRRRRLDDGYTPEAVRRHLERQAGVPDGWVRLDTGQVVRVGSETTDDAG